MGVNASDQGTQRSPFRREVEKVRLDATDGRHGSADLAHTTESQGFR